MFIITITACDRPEYLRHVLTYIQFSLQYTDIDCILLPAVEPGNDEVRTIIEEIDFVECNPTFHSQRLGCNMNTFFAIENGFQYGNVLIHLEDDVVPASDFFAFNLQMFHKYINDPEIMAIGSYYNESNLAEPSHIFRRTSFCSWGVGLWKEKWDHLKQFWDFTFGEISWDTKFDYLFNMNKYYSIIPKLSRISNIGRDGGTWMLSNNWDLLPPQVNSHLIPLVTNWREVECPAKTS